MTNTGAEFLGILSTGLQIFELHADQLSENRISLEDLNSEDGRDSLDSKSDDFPKVLEEMMRIQLITPQGAQELLQELKITDIESLRKAALEKRIRRLNGFCLVKEQKILESIEKMSAGV